MIITVIENVKINVMLHCAILLFGDVWVLEFLILNVNKRAMNVKENVVLSNFIVVVSSSYTHHHSSSNTFPFPHHTPR